ncbi:hypothetical protein CR513_25048, partial [Mucuna pruriens]
MEEDPRREMQERNHEEEPHNERRRRNDISPYRPYIEESKRAPMDTLKRHIPPCDGAGDGSKSVEEYHRDMEVTLTRANVLESSETTMA